MGLKQPRQLPRVANGPPHHKHVTVAAAPAGCLHPRHKGYFATPADYMRWYSQHGPVRDPAAPTVAVLLYRKHVITDQVS